MIIGGGMVGYNAAVIALGLGAQVRILDRSADCLRHLEEILSGRVELVMSSALEIERSVLEADVIGAVLTPGAQAPKLVTRETIEAKGRAVVCDVSIDQGGCFETSARPTHADPVYAVAGVTHYFTHYCVSNMPGAVPITSMDALTNVTLPCAEEIADLGLKEAVSRDRARGVNVLEGKRTHEAVAEAHGLDWLSLDDALRLTLSA